MERADAEIKRDWQNMIWQNAPAGTSFQRWLLDLLEGRVEIDTASPLGTIFAPESCTFDFLRPESEDIRCHARPNATRQWRLGGNQGNISNDRRSKRTVSTAIGES